MKKLGKVVAVAAACAALTGSVAAFSACGGSELEINITGSTSMEALIAAAAENGVTLTKEANFSEYATYPEIKTALDAGRVDAFCVDGSILSGYLDDTVEILDSIRFSPQEYGIATKLDNTGLAEYLDGLIVTWLGDGTIDQLIADNGVAASFEG